MKVREIETEIVPGNVIIRRYRNCVPEKSFCVLPEHQLPYSEQRACNKDRTRGCQAERSSRRVAPDQIRNGPDQRNEQADCRNISVTVGHRLTADLHQATDWHQY